MYVLKFFFVKLTQWGRIFEKVQTKKTREIKLLSQKISEKWFNFI